jgi:hypothetical protein
MHGTAPAHRRLDATRRGRTETALEMLMVERIIRDSFLAGRVRQHHNTALGLHGMSTIPGFGDTVLFSSFA